MHSYVVLVVVFTSCGLNSGQERVHPSLLIATWIKHKRDGPCDSVRMAKWSKAGCLSCAANTGVGSMV